MFHIQNWKEFPPEIAKQRSKQPEIEGFIYVVRLKR